MSRLMFLVLNITAVLALTSCRDKGVSALLPQLKVADSAAVIFYDSPGNPRYFKFTRITDLAELDPVIHDVNAKVVEPGNLCETRGKIYFYGKDDAVAVVYFTTADECMTFSIIITGEKYFVKMSEKSKQILKQMRQLAEEPVSTTE